MDLSSIPVKNPAVLSRKLFANEMVLVNGDSAVSLALTNQTAVTVWELSDGRNSIRNIISQVTEQFQNVPDSAAADVQELIELLASDGFIGFEVDAR